MLKRILGPKGIKFLKWLPCVQPAYHWFLREIYRPLSKPSPLKLYHNWIDVVEPNLWSKHLDIEQQILISVVVPIYNPPVELLKECVASVVSQQYIKWELVLVDDASTQAEVKEYLKSVTLLDERIKVKSLSDNSHISVATNEGVALAKGEFIALLDHDDLLAPNALNEVAVVINANPSVKWIYSDEDFVDEKCRRSNPHFKPDMNIHLLRAHNFVTHLCVYQADVLRALGGCRVGFEGAQDYDLALRAIAFLSANEIYHIDKILYHWRVHEGSTAMSSEAKPYTVDAGFKALKEHLKTMGVAANVTTGEQQNFYRVSYQIDQPHLASIIIPTKDQYLILKACIDSVLSKTSFDNYEIIIVNNQSECSETLAYLSKLSKKDNIQVITYDKPFNYSKINNFAASYANGDTIVLLNNDTEVISENWLGDMVALAHQPLVGCVGAKLLYPDDTVQHAGVIMGLGGYAAHSHRGISNHDSGYCNRIHVNQQLSAVTAACLVVRKTLFDELGGLDEDFQVAYNDVDFCLRASSLGAQNVYCASAELYHYESKSRGEDNTVEKQARFEKEKKKLKARWEDIILNDPFYSRHLTRSREDFSIRLPHEY
ncbi:glycosyltransferase family 2 protein [Shewanella youngdeokensis]|uniref:Glycosyltransferase family 2 protein n=1 Tax=Shewanella youngdeokensis TaxID=2999068 RepID=A0ABZ0K4N7_9GAMM|nr:glycosyltransferase family 2 protein [Shewanella sp. DAU334]